jgi:hypothetical protein
MIPELELVAKPLLLALVAKPLLDPLLLLLLPVLEVVQIPLLVELALVPLDEGIPLEEFRKPLLVA